MRYVKSGGGKLPPIYHCDGYFEQILNSAVVGLTQKYLLW